MASGIVGNLMAAYVIVDVKESTFYMVMTAVCLASNLVFMIVPKPEKVIERKSQLPKDLAIGASVKIDSIPEITALWHFRTCRNRSIAFRIHQ